MPSLPWSARDRGGVPAYAHLRVQVLATAACSPILRLENVFASGGGDRDEPFGSGGRAAQYDVALQLRLRPRRRPLPEGDEPEGQRPGLFADGPIENACAFRAFERRRRGVRSRAMPAAFIVASQAADRLRPARPICPLKADASGGLGIHCPAMPSPL